MIILPLIAILAVTSEWSQRTGLTTFTLVPHRRRVIAAKAISSVVIAVAAMAPTFAVGAIGNLLGAAVTGTTPVWDVTFTQCLYYVFDKSLTGEQWANIGVTGIVWLVIPLLIGLRLVMRAEIK